MSESEIATKVKDKKRWFSESNVGNYTLLVAILAAVMGFSFHISSGISANGVRIDKTNERIDETNKRIDTVQNMLTDLGSKVGIIENNDANQDNLLEQQKRDTKEVYDRLSQLERDQTGESQ